MGALNKTHLRRTWWSSTCPQEKEEAREGVQLLACRQVALNSWFAEVFDDATFKDLGNNQYQASITGRKSFGTFANGGNSVPYNDMELYLMGLFDASEITPYRIAKKASWVDAANGLFRADSVVTETVQDVIGKQGGARQPSFGDAQKRSVS